MCQKKIQKGQDSVTESTRRSGLTAGLLRGTAAHGLLWQIKKCSKQVGLRALRRGAGTTDNESLSVTTGWKAARFSAGIAYFVLVRLRHELCQLGGLPVLVEKF